MKGYSIVGIFLLAVPSFAGIYSPDEPFLFEIDSDGIAKPIQYVGGFEGISADFRDIGAPKSNWTPRLEARVRDRKAMGVSALSPEEMAGYAADLIRLSRPDEVLNLLQPLARDPRRGGFLVYAHLARAHAARGEWRDAADQQQVANQYSEFPTKFAKLTKEQLAWLKRIEREYYRPFLVRRAEEARGGRPSELREDVDALFPVSADRKRTEEPVRFVGENGEYTPGKLAEAERKKLPADALAIVQQMILWHPKDARLYWLLGELYNAEGEIEIAARILDACSFNMGYSNPNLIRHRQILLFGVEEIAAQKKAAREREAEEERQLESERQRRFWWILSIGVALGVLLVYYQGRELIRRVRRSSRRV
ncbi:MAG: hypothetical protein EXS09_14140 [Gemmataceae bacterium]|nr:hypothetical protein [Gemmataceae bacterium]